MTASPHRNSVVSPGRIAGLFATATQWSASRTSRDDATASALRVLFVERPRRALAERPDRRTAWPTTSQQP